MSRSMKGALLSALLFPGAGQLWLRCYLRGVFLVLSVSACLLLVVKRAGQQALSIVERLEAEGGAVDLAAVVKSASHVPDDPVSKAASAILLLLWVIAIVDAFLAGRKKDADGGAGGGSAGAATK